MSDDYHFQGYRLRAAIREAIDRYAETGYSLGDFLMCVLRNDLGGAVFRADHDNLQNLKAIVGYINNEIPTACYGSVARVKEWQKEKAKERKAGVAAV